MSQAQFRRLDLLERVARGELTIAECAAALGLSSRQVKRLKKKLKTAGDRVVVHGNSGRVSLRKTPAAIRERVLELRQRKYAGFNDLHFTEKLREVEGIDLARATVTRILREAGIASPRRRRPPKHRRRRDRRPQAGQMILWDGSRHDWLEGRGPRLCLMGAIDDATGELLPGAHFVEQEGTLGYLRVLREILKHKGVPLTAYMDRHGTLKRNDRNWTLEEQLAGRQEPTHVKRALDELGVQVIYALSPQAKGRVERLWGTLQDRLVSELRLANASTVKQASRVLNAYRRDHNARFALPPQDANAAWRPLPSGMTPGELSALQHVRQVQNDHSLRVNGKTIDIRPPSDRTSYAKATVLVRHLLSGEFRVYFQDTLIAKVGGPVPTEPNRDARSLSDWQRHERRKAKMKSRRRVTESLSA